MNKHISQWVALYLLPYFIITVQTLINGRGLGGASLDNAAIIFKTISVPLVTAPLMAAFGYIVGFSANSESTPLYTNEFKAVLFVCLVVSLALFFYGIKMRAKIWGSC